MIEFITLDPIIVPLTKVPKPIFPLWLLFEALESMEFDDDVLQCKISANLFVPISKDVFLHAVGNSPNHIDFKVVKPTAEEF